MISRMRINVRKYFVNCNLSDRSNQSSNAFDTLLRILMTLVEFQPVTIGPPAKRHSDGVSLAGR